MKKFFKAIKRFYYRWRNSDPVHHCTAYLDKGCSHVDGMLCDFPNCDIYKRHMGKKFVGCAGCKFNDSCCSRNYGLGCYDGEEIG